MGSQIIQQPNGKLAIYSTVSGGIAIYDATEKQVVKYFVKHAKEHARENARRVLDRVLDPNDSHPYYQFTMTWEEALAEHEERFGPLVPEEESPTKHL